jgi:pimeloyl-ACP methyl ester carboxylesterase
MSSRATGIATTCGCSSTMPTDGVALRASLDARRRGLVLLAVVLHPPVVAPVVKRLTRKPRIESLDVDGVALEVLHPPGRGPWPAWLFINGAHPLRRREPVVWRLARGLARAGFLVVVPDIPGLGEGAVTRRTLDAAAAVVRYATERPDVKGGRVALIGASTGAGLAVVTAGRPELASRVSVVAAVAPYADLPKLVCLTTTCVYDEDTVFEPHQVTELHKSVIARSLVSCLQPGDERERLLVELDAIDREAADPLVELPRRAAELGPEARAVINLLENRDPDRFRDLFDALPPATLELLDDLSPLGVSAQLRAPVEVVVPPHDEYFPLGEAEALARSLPNVHLTITGALDHTRPSLARFAEFRSFQRFVVRGLAAAVGP